ncbi:carbamoyl-phosphate synthase L chain, ATP binding domain-containing protein [Thelonectria olida]|uniref:Carbamoyl-phosphate synthase L chain, ATP binding domain-containing protein n=1 Tax=Thelonectria olida TaxID=1576542 RepID=A0A9P8WBD2_9HYPO|nr:carbamoyl-phosphate synthase L chain, ATP binding domain-containing protein [Thelonectria olida]
MSSNTLHPDACPQRPPLFVAPLPIDPNTGLPFIRKVLVANRGEIASRIIQTCRKLNIQSALIYVEEDQNSRHIVEADNALNVGSLNQHLINPFLNIDLLVKTALDLGADAIHPGYGYLSENADFATSVAKAGLIFIGPGPEAMSTLGDKRMSKKYLEENAPDVPLIPGFSGSSVQIEHLEEAADKIGYPVMLKASAGGGGKGMRVVREPSHLREELERVQSEATRSFGSSDCILEKYIENSKHVEVQILGDEHGNVVSFFERDCSVQRRHQKLIEESPCPVLSDEIRREMGQVAVRIAKLIGYSNAGTVEFVFDVDTSRFFFLEVNARLQVEHPISEEVTGVDLVALQLFAASGGNLTSLPQVTSLKQVGHAIECRLCAEDPQRDFLPDHGPIHLWLPGEGSLAPGRDIRYETAMQSGASVSTNFDSMIAKLVVWAPTREMAIQKMKHVMANTVCVGVKTNQLFLQSCLAHKEFRGGRYQTSFIPRNRDELLLPPRGYDRNLGLIPSFFLRSLHHRSQDSSRNRRPFQSVRPHFRNQHHDPVNIHSDVVTGDWLSSAGPQKSSSLFVWSPENSRIVGSGNARVIALDDLRASADKAHEGDSAIKVIADEYNGVSNILRRVSSPSLDLKLLSWASLGPAELSPADKPASAVLDVTVGGKRIRAFCVAPTNQSQFPNESQTVFCHFPHIGTCIQFQRDSLLTWSENQRASVRAKTDKVEDDIVAPMPCKILSIKKKNGDEVKEGDLVMVIESMKMEVSIKASKGGLFETTWKDGDASEEGRVLCRIA